jgi:hypothetical protein
MRSIIIPIATGLLGFIAGILCQPLGVLPRGSFERENAALREQVRILNQLVLTYKQEQSEVRAVLEQRP